MSGFDFDDIVFNPTQPQPKRPEPVWVPEVAGGNVQHQSEPAWTPVPSSNENPKPVKQGVPGWLAGVLAFLAVTFFLLWVSTFVEFTPGPSPDPNVDPVDGAYVAIFYDDAEKQQYARDQITAMDSAAVAQFLDETVTGWKKIDVDQIEELKNIDPVYAEMAEQHRAKLPWVVVRSGRKLGSEPVTTPDELIELVKRTVK